MHRPDDLDDYLRGDSALSIQYRRESAPQPAPALDRLVLEAARADSQAARRRRPYLAPLAFAASVLLSVALVLAIVFGPRTAKRIDEAPRFVRAVAHTGLTPYAPLVRKPHLYSSDPPRVRAPSAWLADIEALRRDGRYAEADSELRRFRGTYPGYAIDESRPPP